MAILLLLTSFISIFFSLGVLKNSPLGKKELLLNTVLVFCGLVVLITELLSLLRVLNFQNILIFWLIVSALNMLYLFSKKEHFTVFNSNLKQELIITLQKIKALSLNEKCLLLTLVLVFIQGIIYPPNNWDSMTYHVARIPSWLSHQSVAHFPSGVVRQVYQPPFAEYVIMHFDVLARNDYFSSAVQFLSLLFSIVGLVAIVELFGLGTRYKVLAVFLGLTIPEVVLQATSTQNDLVASFFVIAAFYFALKSIQNFTAKNALYVGLAVGLGILTKGTAYIYMPSILLVYGITLLVRLFQTKNYHYVLYGLLAGVIFLSLNFGFYYRNYQLTKNILGVDQKEYGTYSNEKMNGRLLLSSLLKNAGNHIGLFHLKPLSVVTAKAIIKWHKAVGIDIDDPATNYFMDKYDTLYNPDHEDAAPNFIHFLLITAALVVITVQVFRKKISLSVKLLTLTIVTQGLFFCAYLKYQPFHTRLQTPLFLLAVPLICYAVYLINSQLKKLFYITTIFILAYAVMIVQGNLNTPYNKTITESRYKKYFISKPYLYDEYQAINNELKASNYKNIGLIMGDEDWEYAFFTESFSKPVYPVYIHVTNFTKNSKSGPDKVDCIVANAGENKPFIDYNGKRFYNQSPKNIYIYLYQ